MKEKEQRANENWAQPPFILRQREKSWKFYATS
jgi:hypothetical protein